MPTRTILSSLFVDQTGPVLTLNTVESRKSHLGTGIAFRQGVSFLKQATSCRYATGEVPSVACPWMVGGRARSVLESGEVMQLSRGRRIQWSEQQAETHVTTVGTTRGERYQETKTGLVADDEEEDNARQINE